MEGLEEKREDEEARAAMESKNFELDYGIDQLHGFAVIVQSHFR